MPHALFETLDALKLSVQRRLDRSVLGVFEEWLRLVETWLQNGHTVATPQAEIYCPPLRLSELEGVETFAEIPDGGIAYPDEFLSAINITAAWEGDDEPVPLGYRPPAVFDEAETRRRDPIYTVRAAAFQFGKGVTGGVTLHFRKQIPHLTDDALEGHPVWEADGQIYLFGTLAAAHREFRNPMEEQASFAQFAAAVMDLNAESARAVEGASPLRAVIVGGVP